MDALQYQLENERPVKSEALVYASPPQSAVDDLEAEIDQLKESLSDSNVQLSLLRTRLSEVEGELRNTVHQHASTLKDSQTVISDKALLVEQQTERADQR